jgi:hypothetical protein
MSLYGRPKTGKTRLAVSFPKPLLIIGSEDGTASVIGAKGVDFVQLERVDEFTEILEGPLKSGKYATAVLDNGTKLRDMKIAEIMGLDSVDKHWGAVTRDIYTECANYLKRLLRPILDMGRKRSLNVVIIAQEQNFKEEAGDSSELINPNIGPALGKALSDYVNAECDYIGQTLIRERYVKKEVTIPGPKGTKKIVVQEQPTGKNEYCLRVSPDGVYQAGFRMPLGKELKEDFLVNPTYERIMGLLK